MGIPPLIGGKSPGGVNSLLGGLAALAQAVPAYFQGKQLAMNNAEEQERLEASREELAAQKLALAGERLKALGPAAAMGVPGASDAFKSALSEITGAQFGNGQQTQTQAGSMPSLSQVAPQNQQTSQNLASPAAPKAPTSSAVGASTPQGASSNDRSLLEAYGFLTPAQQYVRDNMKELVQVPPEQRIAMLEGAGVPLMPQDAQALLDLPFQPDPTAQIGLLKDINAQIDKAQAGDITPDGFRAIVQQYAPVMKRYGLDPTQLLTDKRITEMTQTAKLNVEKLTSQIGLNDEQKKRVLTLLPYEVKKNIADTMKSYAQANEANVNAAAVPVRLQQAADRITIDSNNLQMRQNEFQLKLQSATTPGSLANVMAGLQKDIENRQRDLTQMRAFFASKNGTTALANGYVTGQNGQRIDVKTMASQMQAVHNQINQEEYQLELYHKNPGYYMTQFIHRAGAPQNVKVTHVDGKAVPSQPGRKAMGGYEIGKTYQGLRYLGGDPNDQASWQH